MVLGSSRTTVAARSGRHGPGAPGSCDDRSSAGSDQFLLLLVDACLAGVVFLVPFLMGGRHAIGQLALTVFAVVSALAWAMRQASRNDATWRSTAATPLVIAGVLLVVLQTIPLSPWLMARLAPGTANLLTLWSADATTPGLFGCWNCISLTPAETLAGLVVFLDFALLFFVVVQRIARVEDIERLLRWCALSAVLMASFGVVQLVAGNGKFFWFYENPYSSPFGVAFGSFTNRNHFANFLALGVGPLIWWLQDALARTRRHKETNSVATGLLGLALGVVLFAGLLSLSRGGTVAMSLAVIVCTAVCYRASSLGGRFIVVLGGAGALIGLSLAIFGYDRVSNRLEDLSSGSIERLDNSAGRRTIWTTTLQSVPDHLVAGSGVGSFSEVYPTRADAPLVGGSEPTHAENGYLQVLLETGVVGLALVAAGIVLCASWCADGLRSSASARLKVCVGAIAASLAASAVHSAVDFVWYVPACTAIVAILAGCAARARQISREERPRTAANASRRAEYRFPNSSLLAFPLRFSLSWAAAVVALACLGTWMVANRVGPAIAQTYWDEYLVACRAAELQDTSRTDCPLVDPRTQEQWIECLENVVRWQPTHVQAHLKLVETHRRLFDIHQRQSDNPMSLLQIGDAVFNEPAFRSRDALAEWLPRAVGPHWVQLKSCLDHVRKALALCPLEGRGYVHVAELAFLWTADRGLERACVEQAMRVRPIDGEVLYAAGNEALLAGDEALWRNYLKRAFRYGRPQQQQIMADRVVSAPPETLPTIIADILQEYQPDLQGANFLHDVCASRCTPEQLVPLARYRADMAEAEATAKGDAKAAEVWLQAVAIHNQLRDGAAALRCARNALKCDQGCYNVHRQLGLCLLAQSQFEEAESHLRWCLQRTPNEPSLHDNLRETLKGRLDQQRQAAKDENAPMAR